MARAPSPAYCLTRNNLLSAVQDVDLDILARVLRFWAITMKRLFLVVTTLLFCASLLSAQAVPTFVGVRTFLGAPYVTNLDKLDADFAVLGVPFDEGTWGQPGERYGPREMREASQEYNDDLTEGFYYIDGDRTVLKGQALG